MKIAIIRQRYNPYGGAERFVERALAALAADGAEVTLIARSWAGAAPAGYRQLLCDPPYSRLLGGRAARDRSFAAAVQATLAREHFDISQTHERIPGCSVFRAGDGLHAAWLLRRLAFLGPLQHLGQRFSSFHRQVLASEQALFADPALRRVICNSHLVADEVRAHYGLADERISVIYNGVDLERFHPEHCRRARAATRAAAGIPADAPLLLFVGSGFARKGVPQLLAAFARQPRHNARLVIVGADRQLAAMRRLAARLGCGERVLFTGPLQDVLPWYGAADAFVLPTFYDPCPNAALEALACGLPTLTTTACGAAEWISEANGVVIDLADGNALSTGLARLRQLADQPAAHAAARAAVAHLSLEHMSGQLLALYRKLA